MKRTQNPHQRIRLLHPRHPRIPRRINQPIRQPHHDIRNQHDEVRRPDGDDHVWHDVAEGPDEGDAALAEDGGDCVTGEGGYED